MLTSFNTFLSFLVALSLCSSCFGQSCNEAFESFVLRLNESCSVSEDGTCNAQCQPAFDDYWGTCDGSSVFIADEEFPVDDEFILSSTFLVNGTCQEIPIEYVYAKDLSGYSCEDWLKADVFIFEAICIDECRDECQLTIENIISNCPLDENVTAFDQSINVTDYLLVESAPYRNEECNELISSQLDGSASEGTPDGMGTMGPTSTSAVMIIPKILIGSLFGLYVWFCL